MLVFLSITLIVLMLIGNQFRIHSDGHLDMFENDGYIAVKFIGIRLYRAAIHFESEDFTHNSIVIGSGKKENEVHLSTDKSDNRSIASIATHPALENLQLLKVQISVTVGKNNDAFFTSMTLGAIRLTLLSALSFIKSRYGSEIYEQFIPQYNSDKFESDFSGIICISIADIIICYFKNKVSKLFVKRKGVKQN